MRISARACCHAWLANPGAPLSARRKLCLAMAGMGDEGNVRNCNKRSGSTGAHANPRKSGKICVAGRCDDSRVRPADERSYLRSAISSTRLARESPSRIRRTDCGFLFFSRAARQAAVASAASIRVLASILRRLPSPVNLPGFSPSSAFWAIPRSPDACGLGRVLCRTSVRFWPRHLKTSRQSLVKNDAGSMSSRRSTPAEKASASR